MPDVTLNSRYAFPTAEGFGRNSVGGRGGNIIHVTNLNDSGPGSLRTALETTGPRIIVFDVAGDIVINSPLVVGTGLNSDPRSLNVAREYCTIAGETAPSPGITIKFNSSLSSYGCLLWLKASHTIVRYLTIRMDGFTNSMDAITIGNDQSYNDGQGRYVMNNVILDHCSLSTGTDENLNTEYLTNSTIQYCMFTKNKGSGNYLYGHRVQNHSFIYNYLSHTGYRNPLYGYGKDGENFEMVNNIIYMHREGIIITYGHVGDVLGNVLKATASTTNSYPSIASDPNLQPGSETDGAYYCADNFELLGSKSLYDAQILANNKSTRQVTNSLVSSWATTQNDIEEKVFGNNVGNSIYRDSMDTEAISQYYSGTGNYESLTIPSKTLTSKPANYDSIIDGMDDSFVTAHSITSRSQVKTNWNFGTYNVINNAGYNAFDIYLAFLSGDLDKLAQSTGTLPDPDPDPSSSLKINNIFGFIN